MKRAKPKAKKPKKQVTAADLRGRRIELAPTHAIDRLATHVDAVLCALAEVCGEPSIAEALVTDESYFSDLGIEDGDYAKLSAKLGVEIDPTNEDDQFICRVAAKLKSRGNA